MNEYKDFYASFSIEGLDITLSQDEHNPLIVEIKGKDFSKVYHASNLESILSVIQPFLKGKGKTALMNS